MNSFVQGLEVSILGLAITFIALGVFILIMIVLQRLFPAQEEKAEQTPAEAEAAPVIEAQAEEPGEEAAVVAAIAAAISYLRARSQSSLGSSLQEGRGSWWASRKIEARLGRAEKR